MMVPFMKERIGKPQGTPEGEERFMGLEELWKGYGNGKNYKGPMSWCCHGYFCIHIVIKGTLYHTSFVP